MTNDEIVRAQMSTISAEIKERGATVRGVMDGRNSFAYTIGFHQLGKPELIMTCPDLKLATFCLGYVASQDDDSYIIEFDSNQKLKLVEIAVTDELVDSYITQAFNYCSMLSPFTWYSNEPFKNSVRVIQVLYCDMEGRFPDEPEYDAENCPQKVFEPLKKH